MTRALVPTNHDPTIASSGNPSSKNGYDLHTYVARSRDRKKPIPTMKLCVESLAGTTWLANLYPTYAFFCG